VTDQEEVPSAVLIRALQLSPSWDGQWLKKTQARIAAGPGKLCRIMQIDPSLNGGILQPGEPLWLEHRQWQYQQQLDIQTTRIGLSQGQTCLGGGT